MTGSRYDRPRRVVQAYRRVGEAEGADNPYPTLDSAARAIEGGVVIPPPREEAPSVALPAGITGMPTIKPEDMGPGQTRGAIFGSRQEAARAVLEAINPWSIGVDGEYGWLIYQDPKTGQYGYTTPQYAGHKGGTYGLKPGPGHSVAAGHTHGDYSTQHDGRTSRAHDEFNSDDFSSGRSDGDYETMRKNKNGFEAYYLGTPSGNFYEWTRKGGKQPF